MAVANQTKTIVGVFNNVNDAQEAIRDLEMEGVSRSDISLVANKHTTRTYDTSGSTAQGTSGTYTGATGTNTGFNDTADNREFSKSKNRETAGYDRTDKTSDVVADAGIGAAIGGVGGLLLSAAGLLTLPVIGPVLAAGPIVAALTGAGVGAAAGGLIGALTEAGIPEEDAKHYAEGVRRGDVLVTVKTSGILADRAREILDQHHAVNVNDRVNNWKERGWSGFDHSNQPLSEDEYRRERGLYSNYGSEYDSAGNRLERGTERAASDVKYGAERAGNAVERGAEKTGDALRNAGRAVKNKVEDAGDAIRRGGARVYDRLD